MAPLPRDPARPGPDFVCVGAPKGGTRWLYDRLQFHPDFWMPPIKELHHLDRRGEPAEARRLLDGARGDVAGLMREELVASARQFGDAAGLRPARYGF